MSVERMGCRKRRSTTGENDSGGWAWTRFESIASLSKRTWLKKLLADRELEIDAMKEVMRKSSEAAAAACLRPGHEGMVRFRETKLSVDRDLSIELPIQNDRRS